jgi:putative two-component system response regulator
MQKKNTILVVDDEHTNLRLMEAMLLPMGYDVITVPDGEKALESAQEIPPDVILLDIMMPKLDGFEVARRLRLDETTSTIPIVMVTGLNEVEDRVKALEAGADDFLVKPVEIMELKARVQSLLKVKAYNDHMRDYQKKLEEEVEKRTEELKDAFEKIKKASLDSIHRLSKAAEYKDEETASHIERMSYYAAAIARKIGLDEESVESILYAAPMHDIGKIGIPDQILLKQGGLDPDEWEVMKKHTTIGGSILEGSDIGFMKLAEVIALTHHEKWDGSGYPKGLKGEVIPLAGRIVAVADVFDSLTSKRPYKEAFSAEKSFNIISDLKGSHFDPNVVDCLFAIKDEILAIKNRYNHKQKSLFVQMVDKSA